MSDKQYPAGEQNFRKGTDAAQPAAASGEAADYDSMTVDELRDAADGLDVRRGDGGDGSPLKADYIKALRKRDRAG